MKLLHKEDILPLLKKLFSTAKKEVLISSPWVSLEPLNELLKENFLSLEVAVRNSQLEDLLITDLQALKKIKDAGGKIYLNPQLHSKFYIFDRKYAVVGSANLTSSGLYTDRNIETAVFIEEKKEVDKLISQFEEIKEKSLCITDPITGVVLNCESSISAEVLLFEKIPQQTYIKIPSDGGFILGRVAVVKELNESLFSTFFTTVAKSIFSEPKKLETVLSSREPLEKKALLFAYLNEKDSGLSVGQVEIIAHLSTEKKEANQAVLETPLVPPDAGSPVYRFSGEREIEDILQINHSGYPMGKPVKFGKLYNTQLNAFLDLEKIYTMHMAVLGTTGSGKTTFIRRILENFSYRDTQVFIFDLYGEYTDRFKNSLQIKFPQLIFPAYFDNIKQIFKDYGINFQEKSSEEKRVAGFLRRALKPDLDITALKEKSLYQLIMESVEMADIKGQLKQELILLVDMLEKDFSEEALKAHPQVVKDITDSIDSDRNIVIYDFSLIEDQTTLVNTAGLIMKQIFRRAKEDRKNRIVVLEEAQHFAPEKGFGEIQSGSQNLSFTMAKKIAAEGRKFNLGMVAVTQRPANISKYVLSQLNTQAVFKLINRNDLEAVSVFFEYSKEDIFNILPFLKPGTAFITGLAVPFGILSQIKLG
ncbi:helicase HerA domain-containing protein [Persephonella sp.]